MLVLLDIEWIETEDQTRYITQLAALRVDEHWESDDHVKPASPWL